VFRIVEIMQDLDAIAAEEDPLNLIPKEKGGLVRLDYNPCCGTHVKSLKDLQCIKLLHQEKIRSNNSRLYFVVGQRALDLLQETYQVIKDLAPVLSAPGGPETYVDKVIKTQKAGRDAVKQVKNLLKEVAAYQVRDWVAELKEKNPITTLEDGKSTASAPYLIKYHRDDVDMDFLGVITALLTDNDVIQGQRIFMLSAGEKKEGGPMIIIGQSDEAIKKIATEVSKLIDIKGGGKGRWQGKAKSWQGLDSAWLAAEALVHA
jgi:alanyl-tRNA synthetase